MFCEHKKYWAHRFGSAHFLPTTREEMELLGWEECDVILVTGDAYIDHPSFGTAVVGRALESCGFRVGVIPQPLTDRDDDFLSLGRPKYMWGVNAGNMDSMVNHYTSERRRRSDDAYSPGGKAGLRPDRAAEVYTKICKRLTPDIPVVIGGIEASLRRFAHFDFWENRVFPSILERSGADLLLFGNSEQTLCAVAHELSYGKAVASCVTMPGVAAFVDDMPDNVVHYNDFKCPDIECVELPSFDEVRSDRYLFALASRLQMLTTKAYGPTLYQRHGKRILRVSSMPNPLSESQLDFVFDLPYTRLPHPRYGNTTIPAYEMIKDSVITMRGCFGGCSFCSIAAHEGRVIQSRSEASIMKEVRKICSMHAGGRGTISDLGGPSANMYDMYPQKSEQCKKCQRFSCLYPKLCPNIHASHDRIIKLYAAVKQLPCVKNVFVTSGVRYELALQSQNYIEILAKDHTCGLLKIAPEHVSERVLKLMMKPPVDVYDEFARRFEQASLKAGKIQHVIPYFIASHPGCDERDMLEVAVWLKKRRMHVDQVQNFLPTPMSASTTMYCTGYNPLEKITRQSEKIYVAYKFKDRELQKKILRYHDPKHADDIRRLCQKYGIRDLNGAQYGRRRK